MEQKLNNIEKKIEDGFESLGNKVEESITWNNGIIALVEETRRSTDKTTKKIQKEIERLEERMDLHDTKHVRVKMALTVIAMLVIIVFLWFHWLLNGTT